MKTSSHSIVIAVNMALLISSPISTANDDDSPPFAEGIPGFKYKIAMGEKSKQDKCDKKGKKIKNKNTLHQKDKKGTVVKKQEDDGFGDR
ncbi:hypothetical protein MNBD_GAMMA12-1234 [hydrothermal vent metagenome]|uniref:Uncharacterized protein n=1 Tax=hydrothermal vent metagenome TaxID=652676 RepID=A0A3B0Z6I6_9ZZZZ